MAIRENFLKFSAVPAPTGFESGRTDCIAQAIESSGVELTRTPGGSLIAHRAGNGPKVTIYAPIDEPALLVTKVDQETIGRFTVLGSCEAAALAGREVYAVSGGRGMVLPQGGKDFGALKADNLVIDGYEALQEGEKFTLIPFARELGDCLYAASIGGALLGAILAEILNAAPENVDLSCVFAAQHALGARDAGPIVYHTQPEIVLSLTALEADDLAGGGKYALHGGVYALLTAGRVPTDPRLFGQLCALGAKTANSDAPELPQMMASRGGCRVGGLGIAVRGVKALACKAALDDAQALCDTVYRYLETL